MRKAGVRYKQVRSVWGKLKRPKQVSHCKACFHYERDFVERGGATSGVLPEALKRAVKLVTKVAFAEASELLNDWGMPLTKSSLERLSQAYGDTAWDQAQKRFELSEPCLVMKAQQPARRFVIEADGCFVLERNKAETGELEGREVKRLIYPLNRPERRVSLSRSVSVSEFRPLAQGLLRQAGIRQGDSCLGLGDGAPWVRQLLGELGAQHSLLDVVHALSYLATLLQVLGFSGAKRLEERKRWLRGEVDGALWLHETQAHYHLTDALRQACSDEAQTAWNYLQTYARQGALAYPTLKAQGWVIGSGQSEGYNKWAILERMRGSGMHGSKSGLRRMAFLRADFASSKPLTDFHQVRHQAFP